MSYNNHYMTTLFLLLLLFTNFIFSNSINPTKYLIVYNGFSSNTGFPQDYFFYYEGEPADFSYDTWVGSPLTDELLTDYDVVFEFTIASQQRFDNRNIIKKWLLADGSRDYFLSGDDWLKFEENNFVAIYQPGSFEYDILGITKAYKNLGYIDGPTEKLIISPVEDSELGHTYYTEFTVNRNEFLYYYNFPSGIPDGLECLAQAQADFKSIGKEEIEYDISIKNYLANGNQIVFVSFDPISLVDENNYSATHDFITLPFLAAQSFPIPVSNSEEVDLQPDFFSLSQNYPNPFNPTTTLKYSLPVNSRQYTVGSNKQFNSQSTIHSINQSNAELYSVQLKVYDILGREVVTLVNEQQKPGVYQVDFDAAGLASGIYIYSLSAGTFSSTKKMILLR